MHLERFVHFEKYPEVSALGDVEARFTSFAGDQTVLVPMLHVPANRLRTYRADKNNPEIEDSFFRQDTITFPVHPQVLDKKMCPLVQELATNAQRITYLPTAPTASLRTFLAKGQPAPFIKTHFPGRISRHTRQIRERNAQLSQWLTNYLDHLTSSGELVGMGLFPDLFSLVYGHNGDTCAATIRDSNPIPKLGKGTKKIPLFALYSRDIHAPNDQPLLIQLAALHGKRVDHYLIENIITPHLCMWGKAAYGAGVLLESHGQNTVAEFDDDWNLKRFSVRDLGSQTIWPARLREGFELPPRGCYERECPISIDLSLTYDFLIGHVLYDKLVATAASQGLDAREICARVKAAFNKFNPWAADCFPTTVIKWEGLTNQKRKVDSGQIPVFR